MSEETFFVNETRDLEGKCILCGNTTNILVGEANASGGSTFCLCNECGQNLFNRLNQDKNFREIAKQKSW